MEKQIRKEPPPSLEDINKVPSNKKANILRKHPNLYVKGGVKDLAELIYKVMIERVATYSDEACANQQTSGARLRSIEDLFMVSRTYFPKISYLKLEERVKQLYAGNLTNDAGPYLCHSFCDTVKREVHGPSSVQININWVRENLKNNLEFKG